MNDNPFAALAPLAPGERVVLVSPSSPGSAENLQVATEALASWGLDVQCGESVLAVDERSSYLAGADAARAHDLMTAWCDESVSAVISLRGGFGAMRLLDLLDFDALTAASLRPDGRPKLLAGSSDVTALHEAWRHHLHVPTLFNSMPGNADFARSELVRRNVKSWLMEPWGGRVVRGALDREPVFGDEPGLNSGSSDGVQGHAPDSQQAGANDDIRTPSVLTAGTARGFLTGGNLSLLAAGVGAAEHDQPGAGRPEIVLLEDVTEEPYRLDNLLLQLERSGWFDRAAGIVLGSWDKCGEPREIITVLRGYFADRSIPVVAGLGLGHDPESPSVGLGVPVELRAPAGGQPELEVLTNL